MRFVCETCQTRYIIPDERARGRVLKVRCKKCSNVIVLRLEDGVAGESPKQGPPKPRVVPSPDETRVVAPADLDRLRRKTSQPEVTAGGPADRFGSAGPAGAPDETVEWHVIVGGQQLGPLPLSAVIEKMVSGQMNSRTYLWRDPMPEWKRASQVSEVSRWLPASRTPLPTARSEPGRSRSGGRREALREEAEGDWEALGIAGTPDADNDPAVESFFREAEARNSNPNRAVSGQTQVVAGRVKTDPFSEVADAPEMARPEPSENTRLVIAQAQIRHSPWRILAVVVGALLLLVGGIFWLSRLGVRLPLIPHHEAKEEQHVFTGEAEGSDAAMRDKLIGRRREQPGRVTESARPSPSPARGNSTSAPVDEGPLAHKEAQKVEKLQDTDKEKLRQLYGNQQLEELHVKTPARGPTPAIDRSDAPLTPQQVSATVARFQSGYNMCIDRELKRNPGFHGGKIRVVTTIMSSGLVKHAQLVADDDRLQKSLNGSPLGSCLTEQTRRMVFPNFQGDPFDAEIPLVLGASL